MKEHICHFPRQSVQGVEDMKYIFVLKRNNKPRILIDGNRAYHDSILSVRLLTFIYTIGVWNIFANKMY